MNPAEYGFNPEEDPQADLNTGLEDHFQETPEGKILLENIARADRAVYDFKKDFLGANEKDLRSGGNQQGEERTSWFSEKFAGTVKNKDHGQANNLNDKLQQLEDRATKARVEYDKQAKEFNTKNAA